MKRFLALLLATVAVAVHAAPAPSGGIAASVNSSGAFSFLKVDVLGQLILSPTTAAATGPTPSGGTAIAVDPNGNFVYLLTDSTGALMTTGGGGGGGGGDVSKSGTPTAGQVAEWVTAGTIKGVNTTGSNNYVKSDSPTMLTPNFTTNITTPKIIFSGSVIEVFGTGSPESSVTAAVGSVYHRTDGGTATTLYVKESGSGNTGWAAVGGGGGGGGSGTVTSFSAGTLSPLFTTSVATSTSTPALTFSLTTAAQNAVFAGPASGGTGAPAYRALVAADIPSLTATYTPKTQVVALATFVFDGAGSAPAAATVTNFKPIPAACTITGYTITSDASGSCVVDVQKATGGGSFSSIVASVPPTLSSASYLDSSTLTGWTTSIAAHDRVKASITSASTLTKITLVVYGTLN